MVQVFGALALAIAASFPTVDAYFRIVCTNVATGRIDPIVSPGIVSGHVHTIVGASNINVNSTYQDLINSNCTSCQTQGDKSAYWTPQLYYQMANGSIIEVPHLGTVVYYLGRGTNRTYTPFPKGFRMLSGDMYARSFDNSTWTYGHQTQVANRVNFNCLTDSPNPETPSMSNTDCKNGLRAQLKFQSCWDGVEGDWGNQTHLAYMTNLDNGDCPPGYPYHLPFLFFEVLYGVNDINKTPGGRFVFSNGDPTGYGFHGDFFNGWDLNVLTQAISGDDNGCLGTQDNTVSYCPAFYGLDDPSTTWNCPEIPPFFNEVVHGNVGTSLPGCNDITPGPANANRSNNACPAGGNNPTPTAYIYPQQTPIVRASPTPGQAVSPAGWQYSGCWTDINNNRTLASYNTATDTMTVDTCISLCKQKKYKYAGLEFGRECYCGNYLNNPVTSNQTYCKMHCSGSQNQVCGGPGLLSLYNDTSISPTAVYPDGAGPTGAAAGIYKGCASEATNGRALSLDSTVNADNMTLEYCGSYCFGKGYKYAGAEYSRECFCGNALSNGGAFLSDNSTCNMVCTGNNGEFCGGSSRLSVFQNPQIS